MLTAPIVFLAYVGGPRLIFWLALIRFEADICAFFEAGCRSSFDVLTTLLFMLFLFWPSYFRLLLYGFGYMS